MSNAAMPPLVPEPKPYFCKVCIVDCDDVVCPICGAPTVAMPAPATRGSYRKARGAVPLGENEPLPEETLRKIRDASWGKGERE